jgi:hypothetical protein
MNKTYDYEGTQVSLSKPVKKLRSVRKTIHLDSGDRDLNLFPKNGDFVLYLPRTYENVVGINIRAAEFPALSTAYTFLNSSQGATGAVNASTLYFFLEIDGLNKSDETTVGADKSTLTDSVFAKFQVKDTHSNPILYNESSDIHTTFSYQPTIGKLDRLHLRTRLHSQQKGSSTYGTLNWPTNYSLTLEIVTLENAFDDYSTMETRISERSDIGFFGIGS